MIEGAPPASGDQCRISVLVKVDRDVAFRVFTEEIEAWWLRGLRYRIAGRRKGVIHIEPGVGGRLFESFESGSETRVVETGRVRVWEPPSRLVFDWRAVNFAPDEKTEVEVTFEPAPAGRTATLVTVTHRGWSKIRPDHPARHGLDVAAFLRMMGLWWGELMSSLDEHVKRSKS